VQNEQAFLCAVTNANYDIIFTKKLPWKMSPELAQNYEDEGKCKEKAFVVNIKQIR
jgi:hypothetical protein